MNTIVINPDVYKNAEEYARMHDISVDSYKVSKEVMDMTFSERKDIAEDYKEEYYRSLDEKYS
jgi:hypothetical protein